MSDEPHNPNEAERGGGVGFRARYGALLKHWVLFVGVIGLFVAAAQWFDEWVSVDLAVMTARMMAGLLRLIGAEANTHGVYVNSSVCYFKIIGECTAYYPMAIYIAAVTAFPAPWLRKLVGVVLGLPVLLLINQGRLISLCYITESHPDLFEMIHIVIWQSVIILVTVLLWVLWVVTLSGRR